MYILLILTFMNSNDSVSMTTEHLEMNSMAACRTAIRTLYPIKEMKLDGVSNPGYGKGYTTRVATHTFCFHKGYLR